MGHPGSFHRGARNLGELLTAELSTIDGIQLVEREEIDRVLGEMRLTASGAVAPKHAIQLGKLAKADALILLDDANATKQQFLRVRLIDTRTSIRLVDKVLAKTDFESDVATIRNSLASKANTLSVPARQLRYISVSNIVNGETGRLLEPFCKTLRQLVTSELHHRDRLVVVEREDLQRLTAEKELSGINLHIRAAASIFESSVRRSEDLSGYVVSCRLTRLGDSSVQRFDVPVASKDVLAVRQKVVDSIASQLDTGAVKRSRAPVSREQEAAEFDRRATQFAKAYRPETSTELREVAFALEPSPDRLRQLMLDYRSLVRDKLGRRRDTEALLAAFRHNQFRALNAKRYNIRMRSFDPSKATPAKVHVWQTFGGQDADGPKATPQDQLATSTSVCRRAGARCRPAATVLESLLAGCRYGNDGRPIRSGILESLCETQFCEVLRRQRAHKYVEDPQDGLSSSHPNSDSP